MTFSTNRFIIKGGSCRGYVTDDRLFAFDDKPDGDPDGEPDSGGADPIYPALKSKRERLR